MAKGQFTLDGLIVKDGVEYFVQRKHNTNGCILWKNENCGPFYTLEEAKTYAKDFDTGSGMPEPLRIVDEKGNVCAWVSRNGWLPSGALHLNQKQKQENDNE